MVVVLGKIPVDHYIIFEEVDILQLKYMDERIQGPPKTAQNDSAVQVQPRLHMGARQYKKTWKASKEIRNRRIMI